MARVVVTLKDGSTVELPNTTLSAVETALNATPEAAADFTTSAGDKIAFSVEDVAEMTEVASGLDSEAAKGEEPRSGHGTGGLPGSTGQNL